MANTFTDDDGDVYAVTRTGVALPKLSLSVAVGGDEDDTVVIDFWVEDADKIIELIREAAK